MRGPQSSQPKCTPPRAAQRETPAAHVTSPKGRIYGCRVFRRGGGLPPQGEREAGRQLQHERPSQHDHDRRLGDRREYNRGRKGRRRRGRRRGGRRRGRQRTDHTLSSSQPTVAEQRREKRSTPCEAEGEELSVTVVPTRLRPEATPFVPEVELQEQGRTVGPVPHLDQAAVEAGDGDDGRINQNHQWN